MLVIINPVATKMSDRVKGLVVYALQGRYDVTTRPTPTPRATRSSSAARPPREGYDVVVAFGGDGTVNEAANGLAGSRTALTCLPGGSNNVVAKLLGIPTDVVDATEHLLTSPTAGSRARSTSALVNGRYFTFAAGMGLDATVVERVDSNPRLKARFGPFYFVECAIDTFLRSYVVNPPRLEVEVDGRTVAGVSAVHPERGELHLLQRPPGAAGRGRALRLRRPGRRGADPRAALRRAHGHLPGAVRRGADRQHKGIDALRRIRRGRRALDRTAARSRSRSTATTSTTCSKRASASRRAR